MDHKHNHSHGHHEDHSRPRESSCGHDHGHAPPDSHMAFAVGIVLNLGFVIAEVIFGLACNSLALLSDAGHNLSDVFGLAIAWGAIQISKSKPTRRHTYGLRRSSILAALSNAVVLLIVVGGITWEAIQRLYSPEKVEGNTIIWVAAAGIVVNTSSALLFAAYRKQDLNIRGAFLHMAGDAAISFGVVVIGFAIRVTGWLWLDPLVSILIGLVIVWGTWGLFRESINLALDAVPESIDPLAVEAFLSKLEGVQAVHDLHIWGMSTTETALTVHLVMPQPPENDEFLARAGRGLHEHFQIAHVTIQIEQSGLECGQSRTDVV